MDEERHEEEEDWFSSALSLTDPLELEEGNFFGVALPYMA